MYDKVCDISAYRACNCTKALLDGVDPDDDAGRKSPDHQYSSISYTPGM